MPTPNKFTDLLKHVFKRSGDFSKRLHDRSEHFPYQKPCYRPNLHIDFWIGLEVQHLYVYIYIYIHISYGGIPTLLFLLPFDSSAPTGSWLTRFELIVLRLGSILATRVLSIRSRTKFSPAVLKLFKPDNSDLSIELLLPVKALVTFGHHFWNTVILEINWWSHLWGLFNEVIIHKYTYIYIYIYVYIYLSGFVGLELS